MHCFSISHKNALGLYGLSAFYWYKIYAKYSVSVKPQKCLACMEASLKVCFKDRMVD